MEKKVFNLAEILKDAPKGTKLWSPICGECELKEVIDLEDLTYPIVATTLIEGFEANFTSDGRWYGRFKGECMLFPSKDQRDWSKFEVKKGKKEVTLHPGDKVLVRNEEDSPWLFSFLSLVIDDKICSYFTVSRCSYKYCIPYNDDTRHLVGTADPCPIDYEIKFEK